MNKLQAKFKLKTIYDLIDPDEHIQDVRYKYSIDESCGLLEINLVIPEEADTVEQFVIHMKDLYRGYLNYIVYYGKWKYSLLKNNYDSEDYQLTKFKMY